MSDLSIIELKQHINEIEKKLRELEIELQNIKTQLQIYNDLYNKYFKLIILLISIIGGLVGLKISIP